MGLKRAKFALLLQQTNFLGKVLESRGARNASFKSSLSLIQSFPFSLSAIKCEVCSAYVQYSMRSMQYSIYYFPPICALILRKSFEQKKKEILNFPS